ncbi:MAG: hypothetical protein ACOC3V_00520 [bacterium]
MIYLIKETMSPKDKSLFNKLKTVGSLVLIGVNTSENSKIQLYSLDQSRGYQTNYGSKEFFYLVGYRNNNISIIPITSNKSLNGRTKKSLMDWWDKEFLLDIVDQDALDRWLKR